MPNPRLPDEVKRRRGTLQPCRAAPADAPVGTSGAPDMPRGLDARERRAWPRVTGNLADLGVLVREHGIAVEALVCAVVRVERARGLVREFGAVDAAGERTGAARELDAATDALRRWCAEFGITPAAAARVRAAPKVADDAAARRRARFAALGAGRAAGGA